MAEMKDVDLSMTEFWYSGDAESLAEYRRLKKFQEIDEKALDVVSGVRRKSFFKPRRNVFKRSKRRAKRRNE